MNIYIIASNTAFTVVTMAKNKADAMKKARDEYWNENGVYPEHYNNEFVVYDARDYLKTENLVIYEN